MDDFLGTSIQYSEYQIKLLEKEHYENQQKIVEELISSGFLDSDYEDTTETETETESTDNESEASLEIKENNLSESESPLSESVDISSTSIEEELSSPFINENNEDLALVLGSDISVVDESNVSNSESIDDASINNQIIHSQHRYRQYREYSDNIDNEYKVQEYENEYENEYDSDDEIREIQQFDIVTSKAIIRFMEIIFSDIKYFVIFLILLITIPHIFERAHIENDNDIDMQQFYGGGIKYESSGYDGEHGGCHQAHYQTEIHWTLDTATTTHAIINDEDDERRDDDDDDVDQTKKQCVNKPHILRFDIMTTKLDKETREIRGHLSHHEIKINPSLCHGQGNNMKLRMRMRNMAIPTEMNMPGLFMKIGAGFKGGPEMMRIFKETSVITSVGRVGRHFSRSHGLYSLVMAFVGIAGFAALNGIDEIITNSS